MYNQAQINQWIDDICARVTKQLVDMNKPFKYLGTNFYLKCEHLLIDFLSVSCMIMQKNGAGVHMSHSCFWDRTNDNVVIARWPSEKRKDPNARMVCIVTIFGVAF